MPEKREPPSELLDLIARYTEHREAYKAEVYKEAELRKEFIDPLLELLGWDVTNRQGYAEAYKEVIHEYALSFGRTTKAPDYCFRIGGTRKFFLEAKKPSVNVKDDPDSSLQLRRYGWSAKLPLCILTNFEEWSIFDTRIRPKKEDTAATARVQYLKYSDFPRRWDVLYRTFSKEAVLKGSFDKYADTEKEKRGTSEVDDAFLKEIEGWRKELAKNVALRNPGLSQRNLNFAIQSTIDRLVFLRICEDRGIETYGRLRSLLDGQNVYDRLKEFYRLAEQRYNSGLFHFTPEKTMTAEADTFTPSLIVDDKTFKSIIKSLYYPESPYEFSILPAEVLGQVYEQFLGRVIRLTPGHRAVVEEKPETKKAGGVYYTPSYVVKYIVERTLGPLTEGKTPNEVSSLKVVDPACGSGSFLIAAYQFLLDWHLSWYVANAPRKQKERVIQGLKDSWLLTSDERKRILLNNIFGVDIDSQAVEVTKLSLLLKVLEQVSGESIDKNQKLFHQRALPDLDSNIKCGNSLVGPDFYQTSQSTLFDDEERFRINVFDWNKEFSAMRDGGFDAVIGNPPYIPIESMQEWEKGYYQKHNPELERKYDTSVIFLLQMMKRLKRGGLLGFISSITWQTGENYGKLREAIFSNYGIRTLINLPFDVFKNAYVDTGIYILATDRSDSYGIFRFPKKDKNPNLDAMKLVDVPTKLVSAPDYKIILNPLAQKILARADSSKNFVPLGDFTKSTQGLAGNMFQGHPKPKGHSWFPYLETGQAYRYTLEIEKVSFVDLSNYPSLQPFYEAKPKLLIRRVISRKDRLMAAYTQERMLYRKDLNPFLVDPAWNPMYVLAIMNSRLISYLYVHTSSIATKDDFRQTTLAELRRIPIPRYDSKNSRHLRVVDAAGRLAFLASNLAKLSNKQERTVAEREFEALDQHVDRLVYELYGLSIDEISTIESATLV